MDSRRTLLRPQEKEEKHCGKYRTYRFGGVDRLSKIFEAPSFFARSHFLTEFLSQVVIGEGVPFSGRLDVVESYTSVDEHF